MTPPEDTEPEPAEEDRPGQEFEEQPSPATTIDTLQAKIAELEAKQKAETITFRRGVGGTVLAAVIALLCLGAAHILTDPLAGLSVREMEILAEEISEEPVTTDEERAIIVAEFLKMIEDARAEGTTAALIEETELSAVVRNFEEPFDTGLSASLGFIIVATGFGSAALLLLLSLVIKTDGAISIRREDAGLNASGFGLVLVFVSLLPLGITAYTYFDGTTETRSILIEAYKAAAMRLNEDRQTAVSASIEALERADEAEQELQRVARAENMLNEMRNTHELARDVLPHGFGSPYIVSIECDPGDFILRFGNRVTIRDEERPHRIYQPSEGRYQGREPELTALLRWNLASTLQEGSPEFNEDASLDQMLYGQNLRAQIHDFLYLRGMAETHTVSFLDPFEPYNGAIDGDYEGLDGESSSSSHDSQLGRFQSNGNLRELFSISYGKHQIGTDREGLQGEVDVPGRHNISIEVASIVELCRQMNRHARG